MSRPLRSKLLYVFALAILVAVVAALVIYSPFDKGVVLIGSALLLLIPGRIQGFVFRDHYRGMRLMGAGQFEAAIDYFGRFLMQVREQPWKKRFIWFAWGIYSWDIEAMTLNNLGVALMNIDQFEASKDRLEEASRVDPKYPVPHFNLAVLVAAQGDKAQAREQLDRAAALGYSRTTMDRVIHLGQSVLANAEGRDASLDRSRSGGA